MKIYALQVLVTLICVAIFASRQYNKVSDPLEQETGSGYPYLKFLKLNASNIFNFWICGILLLIVLNEGGVELLGLILKGIGQEQIAQSLSNEVEFLGDMAIAAISGFFGQKLLNKIT